MKKQICSILVLGLTMVTMAMPGVTLAHSGHYCDDGACYTVNVQLAPAQAKAIALKHAGLYETDVRMKKCELDKEHGRIIYEVEFYYGTTEYEYDIDANDGTIIKFEKDH